MYIRSIHFVYQEYTNCIHYRHKGYTIGSKGVRKGLNIREDRNKGGLLPYFAVFHMEYFVVKAGVAEYLVEMVAICVSDKYLAEVIA